MKYTLHYLKYGIFWYRFILLSHKLLYFVQTKQHGDFIFFAEVVASDFKTFALMVQTDRTVMLKVLRKSLKFEKHIITCGLPRFNKILVIVTQIPRDVIKDNVNKLYIQTIINVIVFSC